MNDFPSQASLSNLPLIESLYKTYLSDPQLVEPSWRHFFEGVDFAGYLIKKEGGEIDRSSLRIYGLIQAYRRYGHLQAHFNPLEDFAEKRDFGELNLKNLGFSESDLHEIFPTLGICKKSEAPLLEIIHSLKQIYCGPIGFEYMDLGNPLIEEWIQKQIEPELVFDLSREEKKLILESLNKSEIFETFIHTKYVGQKRFSLEGAETLIPVLAEILLHGSQLSMEEFVIGMAHRGRLNVLANILQKPYAMIFQEFEDNLPYSFGFGGDVKYHKGYSSSIQLSNGKEIRLYLAANSSSLESVDPIVLGQTRARQVLHADKERKQVGAILIHGDAALAGQGVVYESLEFCRLPGYGTGGTLHIAINNQIGYTTLPREGRSTRYCTDIAKTFGAPVLHINGEDPESCVYAARLAIELRLKFGCDVFLDLNCYRKYGHNEGDEPSFTQPLQYRSIRTRQSVRETYLEELSTKGVFEKKLAETFETEFRSTLLEAMAKAKIPSTHPEEVLPSEEMLLKSTLTAVDPLLLKKAAEKISRIPEGFHLHSKLEKWVNERMEMALDKRPVDWAMAEALAFGTLLEQNRAVRLSGQDCARGTFSQRHAIWWDQENGSPYSPFSEMPGRFDVYNSPLSEFGTMGFEYGYSGANLEALVLWEAQYGDFVIGAEIIIDHYLSAAEQKWMKFSSLTLLLPHGYEGGGPEHSSARMERFLQLCAHGNMQIVNPTTPAQYFHLLRRQAIREIKKPLVVFTPKSLLRHPLCISALSNFTEGEFEEILPDPNPPQNPKQLVLCTGKIYYDLLAVKNQLSDTVLIRIEQLYPLHREKLEKIIEPYKNIPSVFWVQEEPENMGAWESLREPLQTYFPQLIYNGRSRSGSTATGSFRIHTEEQKAIIDRLRK